MRRIWSALSVVGLSLAAILAAAQPASAEPDPTPNYAWTSNGNVIYEAGASQTNQLVISAPGTLKVKFSDASPITPGVGCVQGATSREVVCDHDSGLYNLHVYLYTKNDTLIITGSHPNPFVMVDAGPGNDTIDFGTAAGKYSSGYGGLGNDTLTAPSTSQVGTLTLDGQEGADALCGGPRTFATYIARTAGVTVSLNNAANDGEAGEGDNVCSTIGGVRGSNYADSLFAGSGGSRLEGNGGNDNLYGGMSADTLVGGTGDDDLYGASGDDTLTGNAGADLLDGGLGFADACNEDALDTLVSCES
jgi:Ca2+-binding RTX toxin-like protein